MGDGGTTPDDVRAGGRARCELVLPCKDEAPALRELLPRVPDVFDVVVVDNGSRDDTAAVAAALGARVVREDVPGYGAAVHAGLLAARHELVAVMDGDGSFDPADLLPLLDEVAAGRADLAVGRRRPVRRGVWPWHARLGNGLVVGWLRRRTGMTPHDIAPLRVVRRQALLDLDVRDRRFGYPVELLHRAALAGWRVHEREVAYHPRAAGTRSKVSGSVRGTVRAARDFGRVLHAVERAERDGTLREPPYRVLVVAKAPVAGRAKTRLGRTVGMDAAAEVAAAALLDTLAAARAAVGPSRCHLALDGDLATAVRGPELVAAVAGWHVHDQRGDGFDARLAHAHADVAEAGPGPVVQVGMDTPQATAADLEAVARTLHGPLGARPDARPDAVLGPATDGGWWVLGLRDPQAAAALAGVPMSTDDTGALTRAALERAGLRVVDAAALVDVDTAADADEVAAEAGRRGVAPRFAAAWQAARRAVDVPAAEGVAP